MTGASSGIGPSLAKELAGRGYDLAICLAGERLHGVAEELRSCGIDLIEVNADPAPRSAKGAIHDKVAKPKAS